jgi:hypothetical protein
MVDWLVPQSMRYAPGSNLSLEISYTDWSLVGFLSLSTLTRQYHKHAASVQIFSNSKLTATIPTDTDENIR